jgi:hypothetical protein
MDNTLQKYMQTLSSKSCGSQSDLSLLNNPNLEAERATEQFIQKLVDQSTLLKAVTSLTVPHCKGEIPRFDACDIGAAGACAADCLPTFNIQDSYLTYDLVKYVVSTSYDQDMLDCNKYGDAIKNIQMDMMMMSLNNAMEKAAIMGDEDLATGAEQSASNNLLGVNDGWLKKAAACTPEAQIIDAEGAGPSAELFMNARKLLPTKYKSNRGNYKFIGGPSLSDWYAQTFSNRITAAGDQALVTGKAGSLWGNDFFEVPLWPETFAYGSGEVSHILFTPLNNLVHIMQRKLDFKTEYILSCDRYLTVGYFRQDVMIADPDAVILVKNVDFCGTPYAGCVNSGSDDCGLAIHNPLA